MTAPAHFIRVLEMPEEERRSYDTSSLRLILHAAAPCPAPVKRRMIDAFPSAAIWEFYGASEGNTGFVNVFNIPKTAGICPTPVAFVEYDPETGEPVRDEKGRVHKVRGGKPGLLG